ncbi:MAG: hypothetical protein J6T23_03095 [Elusimicrobia bacterium]|nr:hypothetical protein [Elusimicrobiota bacterium]
MAYHISVFLENNPGKLEKITTILSDNGINLRAMSLASSGDFGVMKLLVDDPDKAFDILRENKIAVSKRQIIGVVVDNVPGSFNKLLLTLSANKINIEDCYGFLLSNGTTAAIVLEIENYPDTAKFLCDKGFDVLSSEKIYKY